MRIEASKIKKVTFYVREFLIFCFTNVIHIILLYQSNTLVIVLFRCRIFTNITLNIFQAQSVREGRLHSPIDFASGVKRERVWSLRLDMKEHEAITSSKLIAVLF